MDAFGLVIAAVAGLVAWVGLYFLNKVAINSQVKELLAKAKERATTEQPELPVAESDYVVEISDIALTCRTPDKITQFVSWSDLQQIDIITTDQGPLFPDFFWVFRGGQSQCVVPAGAAGEKEMLNFIQKLPGFDNKAGIEAIGSASNRIFLCWKRS